MTGYKLTIDGWPQRLSDGAFVNPDSNSEYLYWLAAGNTPLPADLSDMKAQKSAEISSACQAYIYAGFSSSALGSPHHYPASDKDQMNLAASVLSSILPGIPSGWSTLFPCMDAIGTWAHVDHTAAQIQQVGLDAKAAITAAQLKNKSLQDQIAAATDATTLASIVW